MAKSTKKRLPSSTQICAILHRLYYLKNVKNTHEEMLLLDQLEI